MMRTTILLLFVALVLINALSESDNQKAFTEWMQKYNKIYSSNEFAPRYAIWKSNIDFINKHNSENHTFTVGMNSFGDLTAKEFKAIYNGLVPIAITLSNQASNYLIPEDVDWRKDGAVTGIKNQGQCGSCWTFSSTGGIEGQWKLHKGPLVSLSEQNILDCDTQAYGCSGGWMDWAFAYVERNGGIDTEASYPYEAVKKACRYNPADKGASINGYQDVTPYGNENALANAIASVGPISVAIDASHSSFQFYRGGIYYEPLCSTTALDHAVLAVGYGPGYYIVKNSWGTDWGLAGYINMSRDRNNNCGIASRASHPIVA
jgi:cathepsin L